jgi:hypothetical protein
MKAIVKAELERERYEVVEEPLVPPRRATWRGYRPDLLGYRSEGGAEELVIVECETRPSVRNLDAKKHSTVWFQPRIDGPGSVRRILAVPEGGLHRIDLKVREHWEVWILGRVGPKQRIGSFPRG